MRKYILIGTPLALVALLFLGVWTGAFETIGDSPPKGTPQVHVHANGLQLSLRENYRVTTTPVGFVIEPPNNEHLRQPLTVSVRLLKTAPEATGHRLHYLGSWRIAWYTATHDEEGGSSGVDWTVLAFEHVGDHWIEYGERKLSEWEPNELWEIARALRYVPAPAPKT
jgi:hypothetical protein